jgi:hypothetical protein
MNSNFQKPNKDNKLTNSFIAKPLCRFAASPYKDFTIIAKPLCPSGISPGRGEKPCN